MAPDALPPEPPPDLPPPPDQAEWDEAAQAFLLSSLADVQASAERWSTALGGLLGLFGTIAVVTGPDKIADVSDGWWEFAVTSLIVVAGLGAGVALYLAAVAQMRPTPNTDNWNGTAYQAYVIGRSQRAGAYLNLSRVLGVVATGLLFAAGVLMLVDAALA